LGVFGVGVLLWRSRALNVVELGRRTQVTLDPGLELDPALSPDRRFIAYVAGRPGRTNLFVRQVDGGLPIRVVTDQGEQRFPTWSPDGERLLFASTRGIEIVPALGGVPRVLIAGVGAGADSRLRPGPIARDGRAFVFASSDSVLVKPLDGGQAHLVTAAWEPHSFAWSPDGRWIAYASGNSQYVAARYLGNFAPSSIWVVAAVGGAPIRVTGAQWLNVSPAWLPGGSLLYISNRDGGRDVYQVGLTRAGTPAGPPRRVTTGLNAHSISVSADGTRLAYSAFTETSNVWSILPSLTSAVSVSQAQPVTNGNQTIEAFDISRDGRWLVFDSNRNGVQQIYRVPLGGGEAQRLTNDSGGALWPRWSPDGREIAFQTFHGGRRQAYVASAEGEGAVQVSASADDERGPTWAPDGQRLLTLGNWPTQPRWHVFTRNASRAWSAGEQGLLVIGLDTVPPSVGDWSPDGRMLACGCGASVRRTVGGLAPRPLPAAVPLHEYVGNAARPGDIPFRRALNGSPSREDRGVAEDSDLEIGEFRIRPLHVARHRLGDLLCLVQHRSVRVRVEVIVSQESLQRRTVLLELGIRGGLFEFDDLLLCRTCCLSPGSTAGEQSQQRDYESAFHWYPLGDRWRDTSSVHGLLPARHRSHEECQSVLETLGRRHLTLVVPQADDNQVMRWNDQRVLAAHTR